MPNQLISLQESLRGSVPVNSPLRRLMRRVKVDVNEMLWSVKPTGPQIGEFPELAQLRQIANNSSQPEINPNGRRIIIFSMRVWGIHNIWEGLIGRSLLERGANVKVVICDGLPRCDMYSFEMPGYSKYFCKSCFAHTRQLFHLFGLPLQSISNFLNLSDIDQAKELVTAWSGDYRSFVAEGLPLGKLVRPSVARTLIRGNPEEDPLSPQLYREYLEGGILLTRMFRRMLDALNPDTLIMINGMFFAELIGTTIAQERQLHIVTHERGFMRDQLILAHDQPVSSLETGEVWPQLKNKPLTTAAEAELNEYLSLRQTGKNQVANYWPSVEARHEFIVHHLRLDQQKPILTLFTNVLWDTSLYQSNLAFNNMLHWIEYTIHQLADLPTLQMIIRVHPAEVLFREHRARDPILEQLAPRFQTFPKNVIIVPPESDISSYALIDLSTAVTVYSSTIGLEAALRGVPTIVSGQVHYRDRGFTLDVGSPEQYSALLKDIPNWQPSSTEVITFARRYAHLFFFRYMLPLNLVTESDNKIIRFNISSFNELKPNQHKILDHICTAILEHKNFVLT